MGPPLVGVGQGVGPLQKKAPFFVKAPPPGPLRREVVLLTGYPPSSQGFLSPPWARTWDRELRYPFEVVPTTNWASSSVGSESAPHLNMSFWSWVRALTEAKEKGMGHAPIACEWDHSSSEWARGWGPYKKKAPFFVRAPPLAHSDLSW